MPDLVPAAPAPVAAEPTPTPPPAQTPTPTPAPEAAKPTSKELAGKLFSLLTAPTPTLEEQAKPKKEPKPAEAAPAAPAPKADVPVADDKQIKRRVKETPTSPPETAPAVPKKSDLNKGPTPAPATPAAPAKPEETNEEFEKSLVEEERAQLDDARSAEKYLGEKYKGHGAKMEAFLKENAKKVAAVQKGELDQSEYETWHGQHVPKIGALDLRSIERARVKEDVKKEFEPRIEEERHARWVDTEAPKIKAKGNEVYTKLSGQALPDDVMAVIAERTKGITDHAEYLKRVQDVQKDYALEFEIAETVVKVATDDIEEFHRLTTINPATSRPLTAFDPKNATHERLVTMVTELCREFKTTGGAELKKDGKWFATREEWQDMTPEQRANWWTFTNDELIERALGKVKLAVKTMVDSEHKRLESRGFKRTIAPAVAATPPAPPPSGSGAPPAPRPAPVQPGGSTPQPSLGASLAGKLTNQPVT